jgi:myo-inositol 2-dehydrogenase/D-chiro-inositol 1-dehydrogenase
MKGILSYRRRRFLGGGRGRFAMTTIRYGVIGTGMMGIEHIMNIAVIDDAVVTAISDPDDNSRRVGINAARGAEAFTTHQELLASGLCDAVVIAAPNFRHREILNDVIDSGIHLLTEKPMCTTTADCLDVIAHAEGSTAVNWVGLEYRYMPPVRALLDRLDTRVVGDVTMVAIREHRFPFLPKVASWNRLERYTGGTLVEKCCHFFDLMNLIVGERPDRVVASGAQDVNHIGEVVDGETSDMIDNAFAIVEYPGGARASLDLCMFAEGSKYQEELVVTGSEGKIEAFVPPGHANEPGLVRVSTRSEGVVEELLVDDPDIPYRGHHHGSSWFEHLDFLEAIRSGTPPLVDFDDGLWSVAMGEAAHLSIDERRIVEMAELVPGA